MRGFLIVVGVAALALWRRFLLVPWRLVSGGQGHAVTNPCALSISPLYEADGAV
jgi:hypothetical protein